MNWTLTIRQNRWSGGRRAIWSKVLTALSAATDLVFAWQDRAQQRRQLATMDDRLLRDIGISRLDALHEANKPFWRR